MEARTVNLVHAIVVGLWIGAESAMGATVVRLRSAVDVAGSHVRMGDVARFCPADAAQAGFRDVVLGVAPARGQTLDLSADSIRNQLEKAGLNMAQVVFVGPAKVSVHGRGDTPPPPQQIRAPAPPVQKPSSDEARQAQLQHIRREVERFVLKHIGCPAQQAHVEMDLSAVTRCVHRHPENDFQVRSTGGGSWLGQRSVLLMRYENGEVRDRVYVPVKTGLYQNVVVVGRRLAGQACLRPEDVSVERRLMYAPVGTIFQAVADVVGKRTVRPLNAGSIVQVRDVAAIPLVYRGDAVTVRVRGAGFVVRCVGRAKEDGMRGRFVQIQRLDSRETFLAQVVGPRLVEVCSAPVARPTGVVQLGKSRATSRSFGSRWARPKKAR